MPLDPPTLPACFDRLCFCSIAHRLHTLSPMGQGQRRAQGGQALELVLPPTWALPWVAFQHVDLSKRWCLQVWLLHGGQRLCEFAPANLHASVYLPPVAFWEPVPAAVGALEDADDHQPAPPWWEEEVVEPEEIAEVAELMNMFEVMLDMEEGRPLAARPSRAAPRPRAPPVPRSSGSASSVPELVQPPLVQPPLAPVEAAIVPVDPVAQALAPLEPVEPHAGAIVAVAPPQAAGRQRSVHMYPRLMHPRSPGPHGLHYLRLVENPTLGHRDMRAVCGYHPTCTLSRTLEGVRDPRNLLQEARGRPFGLLWAFLEIGPQMPSKEAHRQAIGEHLVSTAFRLNARRLGSAQPGAETWLQAERARRDGEGEEPTCAP